MNYWMVATAVLYFLGAVEHYGDMRGEWVKTPVADRGPKTSVYLAAAVWPCVALALCIVLPGALMAKKREGQA